MKRRTDSSRPTVHEEPERARNEQLTSFRALVSDVEVIPRDERAASICAAPTAPTPAVVVAARSPTWSEWQVDGDRVRARAPHVSEALLERLERGFPPPQRELDLHRVSASAASEFVRNFVVQARADGLGSVLIIVGRGRHSNPLIGPVLPERVTEQLAGQLAPHVLAFCTAPARLGGPGALLVRLKKRSRNAARST